MIEDKSKPLYGFFRALVVDNKDPDKYGRVKVWVPDVMPDIPQSEGLWAYAANNPIGGRNNDENSAYAGTSIVPLKGSWVWVFFEAGNVNRPFYWASIDIKSSKVLPECQLGSNYEKKWVVFKSHEGRCIVISDDPDDARVEITGKKRNISSPPAGDTGSVYTIDGNQTTILMDERDDKEKILVRTYQGDFINIDVKNRKLQIQFESDVVIKTNGKLTIKAFDDIDIKGMSDINIQSGTDLNIKSGGKLNTESTTDMNTKSSSNVNIESGATLNEKAAININLQAGAMINNKAGGMINSDGSGIADMCGAAEPADAAGSANSASDANPIGNRD